jgi:ketosteroid isomerase-like protein
MTDGFASPEAAEAAFYSAFAATDLAAMEGVWLDGGGAVCIHPGGGLLQGKAQVMQSWAEILTGTTPPHVECRLISRTETTDLAVHLVEESIRAGGDPRAPVNRVLATNVFVRGSRGWHLASHHASLPLMARRGSQQGERQLH